MGAPTMGIPGKTRSFHSVTTYFHSDAVAYLKPYRLMLLGSACASLSPCVGGALVSSRAGAIAHVPIFRSQGSHPPTETTT
jgi:hypothetical protein